MYNKVRLTSLLLLVVLVLTACGTKAPAVEPTATPEPSPVAPSPTSVAVVVPTEPVVELEDPEEPVEVTPPEVLGECIAAPLPVLDVSEVTEDDWVKGASEEDATLTIIEYSDFQCPGCAGMYPVLQAFLDDYPEARLVYRHFPLTFHPLAQLTAEATEAAGAQGKFWEMHNLLFDRNYEWGGGDYTVDTLPEILSQYAEELELDVERFDQEIADGTWTEKVQLQYDESAELGLPGTPTFLFNGVMFPSDMGLSYTGLVDFKMILDSVDTLFYEEPPAMTIAADDVIQATLKTSKGDIVVDLLPESAPTMVNNFVFLAEEQWYDGAEFFFVVDNFAAVTGDPTNTTVGYPGYYCTGETQASFDRVGLVGMLGNGQFFITLGADAVNLNGQFALIGQITEGLDVLDELARIQPNSPTETIADTLKTVIISD